MLHYIIPTHSAKDPEEPNERGDLTSMVVRSTCSRNTARRASARAGRRCVLNKIAECWFSCKRLLRDRLVVGQLGSHQQCVLLG
jgi:hypothetical protein